MNTAQIAKMQRGREKHRETAAQESCKRVTAFILWLETGSVLRSIPPIPTDAEWAVARSRGVVK